MENCRKEGTIVNKICNMMQKEERQTNKVPCQHTSVQISEDLLS